MLFCTFNLVELLGWLEERAHTVRPNLTPTEFHRSLIRQTNYSHKELNENPSRISGSLD